MSDYIFNFHKVVFLSLCTLYISFPLGAWNLRRAACTHWNTHMWIQLAWKRLVSYLTTTWLSLLKSYEPINIVCFAPPLMVWYFTKADYSHWNTIIWIQPTWKRLATTSLSCRYSGRPKERNANFHCTFGAMLISIPAEDTWWKVNSIQSFAKTILTY